MTFSYLFHFSELIYLNIFSKFLSFVYVISKLSILSNHVEHPKRLASYYTLPSFLLFYTYFAFINQLNSFIIYIVTFNLSS